MSSLQILNKIIAFLHNRKQITHFKISSGKNSIFRQPVAKKMQSLKLFCKIIAYLQNQLQKRVHFKKSSGKKKEKCFANKSAYLRSQFKQKYRLSKN